MGERKLPPDIHRGGIPEDPVANAIRYWWLVVADPALLSGTFNSSYELADFLRECGLVKEDTDVNEDGPRLLPEADR